MRIGQRKSKLIRWCERPLRCKFGLHIFDWNEYGIPCGYMSGVIDFFCLRCQKLIKTMPFDDLPNNELKKKLEFLTTMRED